MVFGENLTTVPLPRTEQPPAADPDPGDRADRRLRPLRVEAHGRRPRRRLRDGLQGRSRRARRRRARSRAGGACVARGAARGRSATTASAARSSSTRRAAGSSPSPRGPTGSRRGRTSCGASSRPGRTDLAGELAEGAALLGRDRADRRGGARGRVDRPARRGRLGAARGRRRSRARALRRVVRALPAFVRRLPRRGGGAAAARRARLRRRLPAADPSDRRDEPQRPEQRARRRCRRPGLAVGDRLGRGRPRRDRSRRSGRGPTSTRSSRRRASAGVELALDFAIQCSPDHPWLREHPEWFNRRPDGTLKYAENPPKRYQDIYNVNFESEDWRGLWQALLDVVLGWVERGITVFRVDNPHTKPMAFWEWLIRRGARASTRR